MTERMTSEKVKQEFANIVLDVVYDGLKSKATSSTSA